MLIMIRRLAPLFSLLVASNVNADTVATQTAIECVGTTQIDFEKGKQPETRVYIIDDRAQVVFRWNAYAQAGVLTCRGDCYNRFGANQIFITQEDDSGQMRLDIRRDTGAIMHLTRSTSPRDLRIFNGNCEKTALPTASGAKKF